MTGIRMARSAVSAVVATGTDFALVVLLVSAAGLRPALATALGCLAGAAVNFLINRNWTFASFGPLPSQVARYGLVSVASLFLNSGGVGALLRVARAVDYRLAWWIVRCLVFVGWNYPLQRRFVFRS